LDLKHEERTAFPIGIYAIHYTFSRAMAPHFHHLSAIVQFSAVVAVHSARRMCHNYQHRCRISLRLPQVVRSNSGSSAGQRSCKDVTY